MNNSLLLVIFIYLLCVLIFYLYLKKDKLKNRKGQ